MSISPRDPWLEFWERRELGVLGALPYVLLVAATGLDVGIRGGLTTAAVIDIALAVATGAWMLGMVALHPQWVQRRALMVVFFVGLVALGAAMVIRSPVFGFYTFTGYLWVFRVLHGRWRLGGLVAIAALSAISQAGGRPGSSPSDLLSFAAILLINLGVAGAVGWFGSISQAQKRWRERSIAELTATNLKLEASLRENAGLHAQLLAQAREAGTLDERQRMAHEIHDTLAQGLIGIITQLQAADQASIDDAERRRHLDAAGALARESLSEARRSVEAMRPQPLETARLPEALGGVVARWSALHKVPAQLTTTGAPQTMRLEIEIVLLRTAQEALANVAKHAHAGRVGLTLSYMQDLVTLDVRDDGGGFQTSQRSGPARAASGNGDGARDGGYGLVAMRERVQALSGTLEIESEPGAGTAISASLPAIAIRDAS